MTTIEECAAQGRADALAGEPAFAVQHDGCIGVDRLAGVRAGEEARRFRLECAAYAAAYADALAALAEVPAVLR